MIEQKTETIEHLIAKFQAQNTKSKKQLISITYETDSIHALEFYKQFVEKHEISMYWQSADRKDYMIGFGSVKELRDTHSNLRKIEKQWEEIVQEAIIHNEFDSPGVGLVLMGGMSFDDKDEGTPLWHAFPGTSFTIPEVTIVQKENRAYITLNSWIEKETEILKIKENLRRYKVMNKQKNQKEIVVETNKIQSKNELQIDKWTEMVEHAKRTIAKTKIEKIVLARKLQLEFTRSVDILKIMKNLDAVQENSYLFHFKRNESSFLGASPERLVKVTNKNVLSTCLAGTAPRGNTARADELIKNQLLSDDKNLREHQYVVEMIKQALSPYCDEIHLPDEPVIFPLSQLQHLYTPVTAKLCETKSIFHLVKSLHPTPALGGTPTDEALTYIREHESFNRGWYGAPVGWVDAQMNGEFAVAIRSALIQENQVSLFAGCGIVEDSCPQQEYEETKIKFMSMLQALGGRNDESS